MTQTPRNAHRLMLASALTASLLLPMGQAFAADTAPLPLQLPLPTLKGTPDDLPTGPNVEKLPDKPRPIFMAPKGVKNVAQGKKVTCSVEKLYTGSLPQITDGKKEAYDEQVVEMRKGTQWVQIDLEKDYEINAIVIWHDHRWLQVFRDIVIQAADDPEFTKNVRTIFNNDYDNSSGLGIGTDKEYFENHEGKLIDTKGAKARYLRFYSKGSSLSAYNVYQEVEVYAVP
jgi:hypothetical protein